MLETAAYLGLVMTLVLANGFFVAAEFALVAARRTRIEILAEEGNKRAVILLGLLDNLNAYISATQLGITIASLALGWVGEPAFARLIEPALDGYVTPAVRHTIGFALAFATITFLHIVLGELAPKTMALERTERVALAVAWPLRLFYKLFRWPIRLLDKAGTVTVRAFGLKASSGHGSDYTAEELRSLIDISRETGAIEADEQSLLQGVFEFADAEVREVMVPRGRVIALAETATLEETLALFRESGHSRIPVYREQMDSICGVLYRRELEPFLGQPDEARFNLAALSHPPTFIPPNTQLSTALRQMQAKRTHMAIIVDEYGGFEGLVTLEDLLEEIVGDISDEFDDVELAQIVRDKDGYLLDGLLTVRDLNDQLKLKLPEEEAYTTVAGFVLDSAGRMLAIGESIEHFEGTFVVESLERQRISRVRFTPATGLEE